jgi:hypothetical protein
MKAALLNPFCLLRAFGNPNRRTHEAFVHLLDSSSQ